MNYRKELQVDTEELSTHPDAHSQSAKHPQHRGLVSTEREENGNQRQTMFECTGRQAAQDAGYSPAAAAPASSSSAGSWSAEAAGAASAAAGSAAISIESRFVNKHVHSNHQTRTQAKEGEVHSTQAMRQQRSRAPDLVIQLESRTELEAHSCHTAFRHSLATRASKFAMRESACASELEL